MRMGHEGRSAGPDSRAGLARSLSPPRTMERPGWSLVRRSWGEGFGGRGDLDFRGNQKFQQTP